MNYSNSKAEFLPEFPAVVEANNKAEMLANPTVDDSSSPHEQLQTYWSSVQAFLTQYMACKDIEMDWSKEADEMNGCRYVGWNDLRNITLCSLHALFKTAVKVISHEGYSEESVVHAIVVSALCFEFDGPIMKIIDSALALLRNGREADSSLSENLDTDLHMLGVYILSCASSLLKKSFPFLTWGDALWCFLLCDMDISVAHAVSISISDYQYEQPGLPVVSNQDESSGVGDSFIESSGGYGCSTTESQGGLAVPPSEVAGRMMASILMGYLLSDQKSAEKIQVASSGQVEKSSSLPRAVVQSSRELIKGSSTKRAPCVSSKRNPRQEMAFLENTQQIIGYSKTSSRSLKESKSIISLLESSLSNLTSTSNVVKTKGSTSSSAVSTMPLSSLAGHSSSSSLIKRKGLNAHPAVSLVPLYSLAGHCSISSFGRKAVTNQQRKPEGLVHLSLPNTTAKGFDFFFSYGGMQTNWVPQDMKEELALDLIQRLGELKLQVKVWTDWANERVMQSITRLAKERAILEILRKEKEEVVNFEATNRKKLEEMEKAIKSASDELDRANSATLKLRDINTDLMNVKDAAKLQEIQLAANFLYISRKESESLERLQSLERQKILLEEEHATEKSNLSKLLEKLEQAKGYGDELKVRCQLGEKAINETIMQVTFERNEREQIETSAKSEANLLMLRAENELQGFKTSIQLHEQQIFELKLMGSKSRAVTLGAGTRSIPLIAEQKDDRNTQVMARTSKGPPPGFGSDFLQRERECVMCLEEEISVVFLPCAHQVVCTSCNQLHQNQGMRDCPSCRSPIQRRICARFAHG